jgi:SAM-dependent methyltransferase
MTIAEKIGNEADDVRFGFGENWTSFLERLDEARIIEAEKSIESLLSRHRLDGLDFLDIGSGSGLFSLAARRLGARVRSFDYDAASVECTTRLRARHFPSDPDWTIDRGSVLDEEFLRQLGRFDVVYSWGVLHHTGDMPSALKLASACVKPLGLFVFALYRRTRLCRAWKIEKRWYAAASPARQQLVRQAFIRLMQSSFLVTGRDFKTYVANYKSLRGMDFHHDVHDWLGGYPYESIRPSEVAALMSRLGFAHVRSTTRPYSIGLFGSGCDEFVYRRSR